jgi:hypothetical protein
VSALYVESYNRPYCEAECGDPSSPNKPVWDVQGAAFEKDADIASQKSDDQCSHHQQELYHLKDVSAYKNVSSGGMYLQLTLRSASYLQVHTYALVYIDVRSTRFVNGGPESYMLAVKG